MTILVSIAAHTPLWVWALLAYLLWTGFRSLRPRTLSLARLLILPACFCADGLFLLAKSIDATGSLAAWCLAALVAAPLGFIFGPPLLGCDRRRWTVALDGSVVPLLRNLGLFILQYGMAVAVALDPSERAAWFLASAAVSGLSVGYFVGWTEALRREWFRHGPVDLSATGDGRTDEPRRAR